MAVARTLRNLTLSPSCKDPSTSPSTSVHIRADVRLLPMLTELKLMESFPVTALSRSCLIAADLIVIIVTWVATYPTTKLVRTAGQSFAQSFSVLLLRDGAFHYPLVTRRTVLRYVSSAGMIYFM